MSLTVGFVGLGSQGGPMARRIVIHSTVHPDTCVSLSQLAAERGVASSGRSYGFEVRASLAEPFLERIVRAQSPGT